MKLSLKKGSLVLSSDLHFEMKMTHPFFSEEGASTIPVSLPATKENLALLNHPTRLGHTSRDQRVYPATLAHGTFHMTGKLIVSAAGEKEGIVCSFAAKESTLYSELQETPLKTVFSQIPSIVFGTKSTGGNADNALWGVYNSDSDLSLIVGPEGKGIVVFPVRVDDDGFGFSMLNEPGADGFVCGNRSVTNDDGDTMIYPYLFGITPFIALWRMLDLCFEYSGYLVSENCFREDPLSRITVLNNCADACVNNSIIFRDLVPDITVGELILWLKDKFGATVSFDGNRVRIRLLEECLNLSPDMDLTPYAGKGESISFPPVKHLVLDCARSLKGADAPKDTSIDEYLSQYDCFWILNRADPFSDETYEAYGDKARLKPLFDLNSGRVLFGIYTVEDSGLAIDLDERLGSCAFRYERVHSGEEDKRETDDQYVPMAFDFGPVLPYIGEPGYMHTRIDSEEEVAYEQGLMVCWKLYDPDSLCSFGSSHPYTSNGQPISDKIFPLTPDGTYHMFWRSYNRLLMSAAAEIKTKMNIPANIVTGMDLTAPKLFRGQRVMIKEINLDISKNGVTCGECTLQLIPEYSCRIDDKDIFAPECLRWKHVGIPSIRTSNGKVTPTDGLTDYSVEPDISPIFFGQRVMRRTRSGKIEYHDGTVSDSFRWEECFMAVLKTQTVLSSAGSAF